MTEKRLLWVGSARRDLRAFPVGVRQRAGYQLYRLQAGLVPDDWKPMPDVGRGVREIRIHAETEHRILYVAQFAEGIYVLHAFEKKTARTGRAELDLGRRRYAQILRSRRGRK